MLSRGLRAATKNRINMARAFGSIPEPWYRDKSSNGLQDVMKHPDGHDDHHDHPIHAADGDHQFIMAVNKKTLVFDGMRGKDNAVVVLDN